jgi:uncharacterized protein YtpQ (UPF0354 family)
MALAGLWPVQIALGQSGELGTFRAQVLEIFRQRFPDMPVVPGKDEGSIDIESTTINLDNIYAAVRPLGAKQRKAAIVDFLERAVESHNLARSEKVLSWNEAKKLLRPRLTSAESLRVVPSVLRQEFAPNVVIAYVLDFGKTLRYVDQSDCEKWGLDKGFDVHIVNEWAITNLEQLSAAVPIEQKRLAQVSGVFTTIAEGDTYDAARLLLPKLRTRLLSALGPRIFVGIPCRDLLVACSADFAGLEVFVEQVAEDFQQQPYPITDVVFLVTNSGLVRPATANELARR